MGTRVPSNRFAPAYTAILDIGGGAYVVKLHLGTEVALVVKTCVAHEDAEMYERMLVDALAEFADPRGPSDGTVDL